MLTEQKPLLPTGANLLAGAFPAVGSTAYVTTPITADELAALLVEGRLEQKAYRLSAGTLTLENGEYCGNGAVIVAEQPMNLAGDCVALSKLSWLAPGGIVAAAAKITFCCVEAYGLRAEAGVKTVTMKNSRVTGDLLLPAVASATVCDSVITGSLQAGGADLYVENCEILGGVCCRADDSSLRRCTVLGTTELLGGTNLLLAECFLSNVRLAGVYNAAVVCNHLADLTVEKSSSVFVVDNRLRGKLCSLENNYILANGNTAASVEKVDTTNESGDNLTDLSARAACGVNEALLPKVDRDLFVGMPRKVAVREREGATRVATDYLAEESARSIVVILAPGAYVQENTLRLRTNLPGVTIYAYGVLLEKTHYTGNAMLVEETDHMKIKGLAFGTPFNSSGNTLAVAKREGGEIDLIGGAGMLPDWTDKKYYSFTGLSGGIYGYRHGHAEPYADMGFQRLLGYDEKTRINTIVAGKGVYDRIEVGDTITCRGGHGWAALQLTRCDTILLQDVTVYGWSGFATNDSQSYGEGVHMHRVWVTYAPAPLISKETYEEYRALEKQYGVDFGLSIDEKGRYRGTPHKMSSIDSTHSSHGHAGLHAVSCQFESMCDDGTNQCSAHGRVAGWEDNGDGTIKLYYKSLLSRVALMLGSKNSGMCCTKFAKGELLYMYTSKGRVVCNNSPVLSDAVVECTRDNGMGGTETVFSVLVKKDDVNLSAFEDVEFDTANPHVSYIAVDNHSWSSDHYFFDNCLIRDMRSRGLLIQASRGEVKNCSFTGSGMSGVLVWHDMDWGESGISSHVKIQNNYFENNGHYGDNIIWTPIYIMGIGRNMKEDSFTQVEIEVSGNQIMNYNTSYAMALAGVKGAHIHDNVFGTRKAACGEQKASIRMDSCMDICIEGNTYPDALQTVEQRISAACYADITGADAAGLPVDTTRYQDTDSFRESQPSWSADGTVLYHSGWQVGCSDRATGENFTPYTTYEKENRWICNTTANLWGGKRQGGLWMTGAFTFATVPDYNVVITYRAPVDGDYELGCAGFLPPHGDGPADGLWAVGSEGKLLWPLAGAGYADDGAFLRITPNMTEAGVRELLKGVKVTLRKGQILEFVARSTDDTWSAFSFLPLVIRPAEE